MPPTNTKKPAGKAAAAAPASPNPTKPKAQTKPQTVARKISPLAEQLYAACSAAHKAPADFTTEDLQNFAVARDMEQLLSLCEELHEANLFIYIQSSDSGQGGRLTYRTRPQALAGSLSSLEPIGQSVYKQIEGAGTAGIWTKHLRMKMQVHQTALTTTLKKLESKLLVKQTKNVSFPGRKLYMLFHLEPTTEATGGPWYQDGEPDMSLVATVKQLTVRHMQNLSWRHGPRRLLVEGKDGKRVVLSAIEDVFGPPALTDKPNDRGEVQMLLPHPPSYKEYPTASSILAWINENGIISGKNIKVGDVEQLLTVLMYEGRIEPMGTKIVYVDDSDDEMDDVAAPQPRREMMYRSTRLPQGQKSVIDPGSAFAETPCARCPAFRLCEDGGPVDAKSCGYFEHWLGT